MNQFWEKVIQQQYTHHNEINKLRKEKIISEAAEYQVPNIISPICISTIREEATTPATGSISANLNPKRKPQDPLCNLFILSYQIKQEGLPPLEEGPYPMCKPTSTRKG